LMRASLEAGPNKVGALYNPSFGNDLNLRPGQGHSITLRSGVTHSKIFLKRSCSPIV
jgi:hypothetical protein